jgi:hypothetical protein
VEESGKSYINNSFNKFSLGGGGAIKTRHKRQRPSTSTASESRFGSSKVGAKRAGRKKQALGLGAGEIIHVPEAQLQIDSQQEISMYKQSTVDNATY